MTELLTDTNLIWAAKEAFRFPEQQQLEEITELIQWGINEGYLIKGDLTEQVGLELGDIDTIRVDYTNLFVNGYPTARAHPFAGWYLGDEIIYGDSAQALEKMYSEFGVFYDREEASLPADHIMVELEFLAVVAEEYSQTRNDYYKQALLIMLNGHMPEWVFKLLDDIESNADTAYFKVLAITIRALLLSLQQDLKGVA